MTHFGRRRWLAGLGASAVLLPFLRPLEARGASPKRLVLWFQPNGIIPDAWFPTGESRALTSGEDLPPSLAPLGRFYDRLNIIDGVRLGATYDDDPIVAPHDSGCASLFTSRPCLRAPDGTGFTHGGAEFIDHWTYPAGPSIDQLIAPRVQGDAPIRSLELGVQVKGSRTNRRMSYLPHPTDPNGAGTPLSPENSPVAAFDRVFGSRTSPEDTETAARRARSRRRVLDAVRGQLGTLESRLIAEDRAVLQSYASSLDAIEREVSSSAAAGCTPPSLDNPGGTYWNDERRIPLVGQQQMRILAASLACDLTRVGSLMWLGSEPRNKMTWLPGDGSRYEYHGCSHLALSPDPTEPVAGGLSQELQRGWLRDTDRWFSEQLAFFLGELESYGILDDTLVVAGNELSLGRGHTRDRNPFLVIGGGWHFRTGYYRRVDGGEAGDLLGEVARAMGASDVEVFGDPRFGGGPSLGLTTSV